MNTPPIYGVRERDELELHIQSLLESLGDGRVDGVAYDTAWAARLALRYPSDGFETSMEWLRRHQYTDGTWGAPLVHYHDRYISTLAAIVALQETLKEGSGHPRDARRVKRGEDALWRLVGKLGRDDSDTVGFPILSAMLAEEATELGLEVPRAPIRYAEGFQKKVEALLNQTDRNWRTSTLIVSLEALRSNLLPEDDVLSANGTVAASPSATAGYLLQHENEASLNCLTQAGKKPGSTGIPSFETIDLFEIIWSLHRLRINGAIDLKDPVVHTKLAYLWENWSPDHGISHSTSFPISDIDDTALGFALLQWAGFPVTESVFSHYERAEHFCCFPHETNPSPSVHLNLLAALRLSGVDKARPDWIAKIIATLRRFDENGSYWWDKWHTSPYYVTNIAMYSLPGYADDLVYSRIRWIIRTQNDDGGWGYLDSSTAEETAYCLDSLLVWEELGGTVDNSRLDRAARLLLDNLNSDQYDSLWIHKGLYLPRTIVRAMILGTFYKYMRRNKWKTTISSLG